MARQYTRDEVGIEVLGFEVTDYHFCELATSS